MNRLNTGPPSGALGREDERRRENVYAMITAPGQRGMGSKFTELSSDPHEELFVRCAGGFDTIV